jgi:hypothetical protein
MGIDQIMQNLGALNAAQPAKTKKKAPAKHNGETKFNRDEMLMLDAERIVEALALQQRGITAQSLVESVKRYETPYQGAVN